MDMPKYRLLQAATDRDQVCTESTQYDNFPTGRNFPRSARPKFRFLHTILASCGLFVNRFVGEM